VPPHPLQRRPAGIVTARAIPVLAWLAYGSLLSHAMLGWDGWPMALTARVASVGDFLALFTEELMDGRYPMGDFYRPITSLTMAIDWGTSGLDPVGYHRTDLVILIASSLLLALVTARLGGAVAGLIAGCVFLLHPVQLELLSVPARRADTLCLCFTLAALAAQPKREAPLRGWRYAAILLLALAASGSKESGVLVAPAVLLWRLIVEREGIGLALRRSAPVLVGVALYVAARMAVLGGIGGHDVTQTETVGTVGLLGGVLSGALAPQPLWGFSGAAVALPVAALLGIASVLCVRAREDARRPLLFLAGWALAILAVTTLADRLHDWYAMLVAAPLAGWIGVVAGRGPRPPATQPKLALALAAAVALGCLWRSPLFTPYPLLDAASDLTRLQYEQLERLIEREVGKVEEGGVVQLNPWIPMLAPNADGSDVRSLILTTDYTLQAGCELRWPGVPFRVTFFQGRGLARRPGLVQVQLVPGPEPSWVGAKR